MNANKQDAGGLPELPDAALTAYTKADGVTPFWTYDGMPMTHEGPHGDCGSNRAIALYTADQMRTYGELCRAAPRWGDWHKAVLDACMQRRCLLR